MQNHALIQFFHWYYPQDRHLWKDVAAEAEHLSGLGFGAVWLPPACKPNETGSVGYDIYDLYDLGEFDQKGAVATRYGTMEEYIEAIQTLHDKGVQVYADVILNHKAGADETEKVRAFKVDPENRKKRISDIYKIKAYTKFTFPGRKNKHSDFKWSYQCFTGVDWDQDKQEKAVFKIINRYGKKWEKLLGNEKGNFDYLMFSDVEFRNRAVRKELLRWGTWYVKTTGVDGFRLDAVKHIATSFFPWWLKKLRRTNEEELFAVGEYASPIDILLKYLKRSKGCMSLFDFPLHRNFNIASKKGKDYDLRKIFDGTLVAAVPSHSVTFLDNHDSQPLRIDESSVESWFRPLAYAIILLREQGYPCVFYPDLYGAEYKDKGKDGKEKEVHIEPCKELEKLLLARKEKAYGPQRDYFDDPHIIGWVREGVEEKEASGCVVLVNNFEEGELQIEVGKQHAGKTFYEFTGSRQDKITVEESGKAVFRVNAGSVAVWVREQ